MSERKIIHIDMDAFYASVEQRDNPELRGKPLAVGHAEERGVVAAASYEARRYGVRSAMSSQKAKRLCPQLIFVHGRMDVYKEVSRRIHEIFHTYTDIIEPLSLDEAFLDVTENKTDIPLAVDIAKEIKKQIREELGLIASAGVSYNKFLAKVASDYRKPDGLCTIHPDQALEFISRLPIESFWGVGPVTARRMHSIGIHSGRELQTCTLEMLTRRYGNHSFANDRLNVAQKMDDFLGGNSSESAALPANSQVSPEAAEAALKAILQSNPELLIKVAQSIQNC
jgi:DNA polymerase-4